MVSVARPLLAALAAASLGSPALADPLISPPAVPPVVIPSGVTYTATETGNHGTQNMRVIVFDANPAGANEAPGFLDPLPVLADGQPAEIRIYNLNSFTSSYNTTFCRQDFHSGGMPSALGNLVVASHETQFRGNQPLTFSGPKAAQLQIDYQEFRKADAAYHTKIDPIIACAQSILNEIANPQATNISIRAAAVQAVSTLLPSALPSNERPQTALVTDGELVPSKGAPIAVTDFGPDQQERLETLLQALRAYSSTSPDIAAAEATMSVWEKQWSSNYTAGSGGAEQAHAPNGQGGAPPAGGAPADGAPAMPAAPSTDDETGNTFVEREIAFANGFKEGQSAIQALVTIFGAAIDQSATPPYAVVSTNAVTDADVVEAQVTISGKPPTGTFAQVDYDNTRIGIPGATDKTYTADVSVYGRSVLDFSGGIVLSTLQNKTYYLDSSNTVRQGPSDRVDITFGVLATYYKTQKSGLSIGPSLGVSTGSSTRYLLGLSLIQTIHHSRLLLTVGGASGYVNQLGDGDTVNQVAPNKNVATNSVQRFGGFVGLTWSIFTE